MAGISAGKDAAIGEELAHADRDVRPRQRTPRAPRPESDRACACAIVADLAIGIVEQQIENAKLLVARGASAPARRQQSHVARDFAALEEIQERSRCTHRRGQESS